MRGREAGGAGRRARWRRPRPPPTSSPHPRPRHPPLPPPCSDCPVRTYFQRDQCLANPPQYGSASLAITCPPATRDVVSAVPSLLPAGARGGSATSNGNTPAANGAPATSSAVGALVAALAAVLLSVAFAGRE